MKIVAFVILAALAMGSSVLLVNISGPSLRYLSLITDVFWALLIVYAIRTFRPRR